MVFPFSHCSPGISTLFVRLKFDSVIKQPAVLLSKMMFVVCSAVDNSVCQLGFLSLSFSVLCVSGRLNSPFLSKQSCDPEPLRSPVRQASPLRARGTQTCSLSFLPYRSLGKVWCVIHLHAHTLSLSILCVVFSCISTNI